MFRKFLTLRPLFIATLFASVFLFAPKPPTQPAFTPSPTTSGAGASQNSIGTNAKPGGTTPNQPAASIFETIFGKGATDPNFHLPDGPQVGADTASSPFQEPDSEPAKSIYRYLIAASNIGFDADTTRLKLALATAGQGDTSSLDRLISDFEQKLEALQALTPPDELRDINGESAKIVLRYIQHLKDARDAASSDVQTVWGSPERQAIGDTAQHINDQIRDIVHKYNISLPEGVLP